MASKPDEPDGVLLPESDIDELEYEFGEGLKREGKTATPELLQAAIHIFPTTKPVEWEHEDVEYWSELGFSYLYLVTQSIEAELPSLLELVRIDKEIGWYAGQECLEIYIFRYKAIKIIDAAEVREVKVKFKISINRLGLERVVQV